MTSQTAEQQELQAKFLRAAPEWNPVVDIVPKMATAYIKREAAFERKQRIRAEVWGYFAAPFRRFGKLGGALGALSIALISVFVSRLLEHLHF
jgi:hypothetical protein